MQPSATAEPPPSSGAPSPPSASDGAAIPADAQENGVNDWFRRAFNTVRYGAPASAPEALPDTPAETETDGPADTPDDVPAASGDAPGPDQDKPADGAITLTPEELRRRVQSETDRRMAQIQEDEAARRKREERRRLRQEDPLGYAEQEEQEEAKAEALRRELARAQELAASGIRAYDASVLDPLMRAVPEADRKAILGAIEPGIPGRGQVATRALEVLRRTWTEAGRAEARKALISDQAFVKEVLVKYGGRAPEVDAIPAVPVSRAPAANVNDNLRAAARSVRRGG